MINQKNEEVKHLNQSNEDDRCFSRKRLEDVSDYFWKALNADLSVCDGKQWMMWR